jgi:hypothetical protein
MLELIWGILNFSILIYFFFLCFQATKKIRDNFGRIAALVFVLGLVSFISKPNEENNLFQTFDLQKDAGFSNKYNGNTFSTDKLLEENLTTKISLSIQFGENNSEKRLLKAEIYRDGFVSGTEWKATNVTISPLDRINYQYQTTGIIDWKILGITLYSQSKEFNGKIKLEK